MTQQFVAALALLIIAAVYAQEQSSSGVVVRVAQSAVVTCNAEKLASNHYLYWNRLASKDSNTVERVLFWSMKNNDNDSDEEEEQKYVIDRDNNFELRISNVGLNDAAWYECYVVDVETNQRISNKKTLVSVVDVPECHASALSGSPGDVVTLTCQPRVSSGGDNDNSNNEDTPASIKWTSSLDRDLVASTHQSLSVNLSESLHSAVFTCSSELAGVSAACQLQPLDVKFPPQPPAIVEQDGAIVTSDNVTVVLGTRNWTLTCLSRGNPEPAIAWYFGDTLLGSNASLVLGQVNLEHAGSYRCESVSSFNGEPHRMSRDIHVTVSKYRREAMLEQATLDLGIIVGVTAACVVGALATSALVLWALRSRISVVSMASSSSSSSGESRRPAWLSVVIAPWRRAGGASKQRLHGLGNATSASSSGDEQDKLDKGDDTTLTTPLNTNASDDAQHDDHCQIDMNSQQSSAVAAKSTSNCQ